MTKGEASGAMLAKLAFNGYHVTWWSHETRNVQTNDYPTVISVMSMGWAQNNEPFPDAKTFAEDLYNVFGDCVGMVKDNAGNVLLDNMMEMNDLNAEMSRY